MTLSWHYIRKLAAESQGCGIIGLNCFNESTKALAEMVRAVLLFFVFFEYVMNWRWGVFTAGVDDCPPKHVLHEVHVIRCVEEVKINCLFKIPVACLSN